MTQNRPDFYTLYSLFSYRADAFRDASDEAYKAKDYASWEQLCKQRQFNRQMSIALIDMQCNTKYATPLLPMWAKSLDVPGEDEPKCYTQPTSFDFEEEANSIPFLAPAPKEFGYISEDDGEYHATRRIDWDYLLD